MNISKDYVDLVEDIIILKTVALWELWNVFFCTNP